MGRILILALFGLVSGALPAQRSQALFHLSVIDEVLASYANDPNEQFVEIRMLTVSQNFVAHAVVAAFDENGAHLSDILVLPTNVANSGAGVRFTLATSAFQAAHGFTADFTMPAGIPHGGGMICWGAPGVLPPANPASWDHTVPTNYVDCLAYGSYHGPSNDKIGNPTRLRPEGHSLGRVSETDDNATDFRCADRASPRNNAGATVSLAATRPCGIVPPLPTWGLPLLGLALALAGSLLLVRLSKPSTS